MSGNINDVILALSIFAVLVAAMSVLRLKLGDKFEIRNADILIALIPVALWLVLTGKIQRLEFGDFKIEAAFVAASETAVAGQVTPVRLPVEEVRMDLKRGVDEIPRLIQAKTEALEFRLGYGGYYGPAVEEYLDKLTRYPFFQYVVITQRDGTFAGMIGASELKSLFLGRSGVSANDFAGWVTRSDIASLSALPGYVSAKEGIGRDTDKQTALERMEAMNSPMLPVVDEGGRLAGVVDRSRLTASLIIDVANKVK